METATAPNAGSGVATEAQPGPGAASAAVTADTAGTPEGDVQPQQGEQKVTLADLVKAHPHLKDEIEREFVSPHLKRMEQGRQKLEREIEERVLARAEQSRLQAQASALAEKARSSDENVRNQALLELGKLQLANQQSAQAMQAAEAERQRVRVEMATNFARDVLRLDPATIPPEILQDDEKFAEFAWSNSPRTKQMEATLKEQLGQMTRDANAVAEAQQAADFGNRLQSTPSPNESSGGAAAGGTTKPISKAEWEANRSNQAWRQRNEARILAGISSGSMFR